MSRRQSDRIAPGLLLAMPSLLDENFRRAVVLMTAHEQEGAMGFVVNRPLESTIADVLEDLEIPWMGDPADYVWFGGPVKPESGWMLFSGKARQAVDGAVEILPGLFLSASVELLRDLAAKPPRRFRLYLGHSSWQGGQLESELIEGSWMLAPASASFVFDTQPERMWEAGFRDLGLDPAVIVPDQGVQ
jgi:putative transcriptional regulator